MMDSVTKFLEVTKSYLTDNSLYASIGVGALVSLAFLKSSNYNKYFNKYTAKGLQYAVSPALNPLNNTIRTVIVTGGNGFVGKYIVAGLLEKNIKVVVLDITIPAKHLRNPKVTYIQANLLDLDHMKQAFAYLGSVASVIHCAALIPELGVPKEATWLVNVQGTQNIVNLSKSYGVKSFVYTSSAPVVLSKSDRTSRKIREESAPYPKQHIDTYTTTKEAAERIVAEASSIDRMACCSLRPAAIFGKGDRQITDNCVIGKDAILIGITDCKIDWVPVECVAHAHILAEEALQDPKKREVISGNAYFIGNNEEVSYGEFFGDGPANELSHWGQPRPQKMPFWLVDTLATVNELATVLLGAPILPGSLNSAFVQYTRRDYTFSSEKAFRDFGYKPLFTVKEAIERRVNDYKLSKA